MTTPNPGGLQPGQWGVTGDGSIPAKSSHTEGNVKTTLQNDFSSNQFSGLGGGLIAMVVSFIGAGIAAILGGFASVLDAINGTVNDSYVAQLPTITDHSQRLADVEEQFYQLVLQGNAIVFIDGDTYIPTPGVLSVDIILIAAGAGGAAGRWDVLADSRSGGGGGGGGGEVHDSIPAALLPVDGSGNFLPIPIEIGTGGTGGTGSGSPGQGGGNTDFGSGESMLSAIGGNGGAVLATNAGSPGGIGGVGVIAGGAGGRGAAGNGGISATNGGNSSSTEKIAGGGGGGGGGGTPIWSAMLGGGGGISPGGSTPGAAGTVPSTLVTTGGGGGAGANSGNARAGNGAKPAGGGGGGYGGSGASTNGGHGANGIAFIVERFT
ncbi:hypothetical protein AB0H71_13625 [Nocardia sp. NPDC050697]|uniref:glycine-rich domain-containing protein n=1 Tax=Nocardia sp. NPDC050697 TaxID=3155158 RepID=UPI0033EF6C16